MTQKRGFFSFISVIKHYRLFQCLHGTILNDSRCSLIRNSGKMKEEDREREKEKGLLYTIWSRMGRSFSGHRVRRLTPMLSGCQCLVSALPSTPRVDLDITNDLTPALESHLPKPASTLDTPAMLTTLE